MEQRDRVANTSAEIRIGKLSLIDLAGALTQSPLTLTLIMALSEPATGMLIEAHLQPHGHISLVRLG